MPPSSSAIRPYLPYIAAALMPARVGEYYGRVLEQAGPLPIDLFSVPGLSAFKFRRHELHGRRRHPVDFGAPPRKFRPPCREARL